MTMKRFALFAATLAAIMPCVLGAQVTSDRLVRAASEPQNWLTYSGTYLSQRYSELKDITPANVKDLELKWVFQAQSLNSFLATPLVVDGVM
jgi:glucose dehydrogenase